MIKSKWLYTYYVEVKNRMKLQNINSRMNEKGRVKTEYIKSKVALLTVHYYLVYVS